jgi:hypothetical protein
MSLKFLRNGWPRFTGKAFSQLASNDCSAEEEKAQLSDIVIIGLGGVGSVVAFAISFGLQGCATQQRVRITLVDGGYYEADHIDHEYFKTLGNKAEVQRRQLSRDFPTIYYHSIPRYVSEHEEPHARAAATVIREKCWVMLAVDNHQTRKMVSDHCEKLNDVVVISGSNDGADNCMLQVFIRVDGKNVTSPLTYAHPHILHPQDQSPVDRANTAGCGARIRSGKQLPATVFACACLMQNAFHTARRLQENRDLHRFAYREIYWDIVRGKFRVVGAEEDSRG